MKVSLFSLSQSLAISLTLSLSILLTLSFFSLIPSLPTPFLLSLSLNYTASSRIGGIDRTFTSVRTASTLRSRIDRLALASAMTSSPLPAIEAAFLSARPLAPSVACDPPPLSASLERSRIAAYSASSTLITPAAILEYLSLASDV